MARAVSAGNEPIAESHDEIPSRGRALVLDDQESVAELLAQMLSLIGCDATAVSDPKRALEQIQSEKFDVVLSDYRMPEMNGEEFYHAAIATRPELAERMVFLTGDLTSDETQEFLERSGARYLAKPFRLAKIEETISDILRESA